MEQVTSNLIKRDIVNRVLVLQLNAHHRHNPFSAEMERELTQCFRECDENTTDAVLITGGEDRSFSVGGDFNEVKEFEGGSEVDAWIEEIIDMYVACLEIGKPTISALDHYVIGIGFQLALCCDYRIGSTRCQLIMPELKHGIACVLGQYLLEKTLSRAHMQKIIIDSDRISIHDCVNLGLLHGVCEPEDLNRQALVKAESLAQYPQVSYRATKRAMNADFICGLRSTIAVAQQAHRQSFKEQAAQRFMKTIVEKR